MSKDECPVDVSAPDVGTWQAGEPTGLALAGAADVTATTACEDNKKTSLNFRNALQRPSPPPTGSLAAGSAAAAFLASTTSGVFSGTERMLKLLMSTEVSGLSETTAAEPTRFTAEARVGKTGESWRQS